MAAFHGSVTTSADVALVAATAKTVLQLVAASNHRVRVPRWGVAFEGTTTTAEPVLVRLLRQTTAGTMSAATPVKTDDSLGETLQTTAQYNASAEPTAGDVLFTWKVHPQTAYEKVYVMGTEVIIGGGDRLGIECTAPANVDCRAFFDFEE